MRDYVKSKEVSRRELQENFKLVKEFTILRGELDQCGNCGDKANTKILPSDSWTSAMYCWKCKSITLMIHADRMGGNHNDSYEVYRADE